MAQTIYCDSEDGRLGVYLLTNLNDGESIALCEPCWRDFIAAFIAKAEAAEPESEGYAAPIALAAEADDALAFQAEQHLTDEDTAEATFPEPAPEEPPAEEGPAPEEPPASAGKRRRGSSAHAG